MRKKVRPLQGNAKTYQHKPQNNPKLHVHADNENVIPVSQPLGIDAQRHKEGRQNYGDDAINNVGLCFVRAYVVSGKPGPVIFVISKGFEELKYNLGYFSNQSYLVKSIPPALKSVTACKMMATSGLSLGCSLIPSDFAIINQSQ